MAQYGFGITVQAPFDEVVANAKAALRAEGFGTLSEIDVTQTLREKIGEEIEPYTILGVCNPNLALRAIACEHEVGLLLPCAVLVHACGEGVHVRVQNPEVMVAVTGNERLQPVASEAKDRLERAIKSLVATGEA